jgi:hypothetical protein
MKIYAPSIGLFDSHDYNIEQRDNANSACTGLRERALNTVGRSIC